MILLHVDIPRKSCNCLNIVFLNIYYVVQPNYAIFLKQQLLHTLLYYRVGTKTRNLQYIL